MTLLTHLSALLCDNCYLSLVLTVGGYLLALYLQKRLQSTLFNPVVIALLLTILGMKLLNLDYETYKKDAAALTYLVTPTTICLAVPLYRQFDLVKRNWLAILSACVVGTIVNAFLVWICARSFQMEFVEYMTLLSKSITMAIGVGITQEFGGYVPITCGIITIAGVTGNLSGTFFLKRFNILSPMAQGLAIGVSSHAFGTARALEIGETEGAFSGLAIALTGVCTVFIAPLAAMAAI